MPEQIQKRIDQYSELIHEYVLSLKDVRNVGILAFLVVVVLISWSGIKAIQTNYGLQKQISGLQQQNSVAKLQNENLKLQENYYGTAQYQEVTARQNFGLGAPGETELLIPRSVALAHTVKQPDTTSTVKAAVKQPFWQQNFQSWLDFFLHRGVNE